MIDSNDCCARNNISKWSQANREYMSFFSFLLFLTSIDSGMDFFFV
jgi:hypothetical protein